MSDWRHGEAGPGKPRQSLTGLTNLFCKISPEKDSTVSFDNLFPCLTA